MPTARQAALLALTAAAVLLAGCDPNTAAAGKPKAKPIANTTGADIPADYEALYKKHAATCSGLNWKVLAAVGKTETNHGRSALPGVRSGTNKAGAAGPMQFLAPTWRAVRKRHPDVGPNIYDPAHAIPGAAHLLCDNGARTGSVRKALYAYNHSNQYVTTVLAQADRY
jgi:membrane-bound lytic murein transglycosylase B